MKKDCPLYKFRERDGCYGQCECNTCMLADEAGDCLIKQALQCYVSESRTRQTKANEFSRNYIGEFINLSDR